MANMVIEAKRVKSGQSLTQYETTGMNAINQIKAIKTQLIDLKTAVLSDPDYTQEDADAVQGTIDRLLAAFVTI